MSTPGRDTNDSLTQAQPRETGTAAARVRALAVLGCAVVGVVLARELPGVSPRAGFAAAAALGGISIVLRGRAFATVFAVAVVCLSMGWAGARVHTLSEGSLLVRVPTTDSEVPVRVRGLVMDHPERVEAAEDPFAPMSRGYTRLDLRLTSALIGRGDRRAWEPVTGFVVVHAPLEASELGFLKPGVAVEVRGLLRTPSGRLNPGEPDWLALARQKGSAGMLDVPHVSLIKPTDSAIGVRHRLAATRYRVLGALRAGARKRAGFEEVDGGDELLAALLLGIRGDSSESLPTQMRRLGLAHLMAISGFHLALAAGFALFLLRAFRDLGRAEPVLLAVLVLVYVAVLPVRTPVLRAALMVLGLLGARAGGRRYDSLGVLSWIAVGLLVWRPLDVFSLGYQLSLGITALLITMPLGSSPGVHQSSGSIVRGAARWPARAGSVCLRCWAVGQPAVLAHFGTLSPLGWLATLIVVLPITGLLGVGYLALMLGSVWPGGGRWVMGLLEAPADGVVRLVGWMDTVPGAWYQTALLPWWAAGAMTVAVVFVVLGRGGIGRTWVIERWTVLTISLALCVAVLVDKPRTGPGVLVRVDTVAVGNGSCHLVRSGSEALLFDAGSLSPGVGRELLPSVLRALGVTRVPVVVVSHPNLDHYNALADLAEPLGIERVYLTEAFFEAAEEFGPEREMLERLEELGLELVRIGAGDSLVIGAARLDVLWPVSVVEGLEANDTSIIARLHTRTDRGARAVLFTGDSGEIPLSAVLGVERFPRVDVLELPHHGSYNAVSERLVRELDPAVVVQSTGRGRLSETRWDSAKQRRVWRTTASDGCVTTTIHGDGRIEVRTQRGVIRRASGSPG